MNHYHVLSCFMLSFLLVRYWVNWAFIASCKVGNIHASMGKDIQCNYHLEYNNYQLSPDKANLKSNNVLKNKLFKN